MALALGVDVRGLAHHLPSVDDRGADHQDDEERDADVDARDRVGELVLAREEPRVALARRPLERDECGLHVRHRAVGARHVLAGLLGILDPEVRERHVGLGHHRRHRHDDRLQRRLQGLELARIGRLGELTARVGDRGVEGAARTAQLHRLGARLAGVEHVLGGRGDRRGELLHVGVAVESRHPALHRLHRLGVHLDERVVQVDAGENRADVERREQEVDERPASWPRRHGRMRFHGVTLLTARRGGARSTNQQGACRRRRRLDGRRARLDIERIRVFASSAEPGGPSAAARAFVAVTAVTPARRANGFGSG